MTVRVTLFHNAKAGFGHYSAERLMRALRKKGLEPRHYDKKSFKAGLDDPGDLVVIAGGDGTVGKIAKRMIGKDVPLAIVPLGTANNIATSMGISGKPEAIIAGWDLSRRKSFSVGAVKRKKEKHFLESVGLGVFPHLILQREEKEVKDSRKEELDDALKHQMKILSHYSSQRCTITLDGRRLTGQYLLVEVMNIPFIGPNLRLAPEAEPGDQAFDVILVAEKQRVDFARFLVACLKGRKSARPYLPQHRARSLQIEWAGRHYHIDDKARVKKPPVRLTVELIPDALEFLAPEV